MDNPEYTFQVLEVFSKIKTKEIPRELEEYISYVARTGDPVFQWSLVKVLIKEKLVAVLNEFKENNPSQEIPPCPNVDPFNYETLKGNLLTRLDSFILPPFTIQRICELLSAPRKEYNRIDKYMRAVEKNVLVVSACELSLKRGLDSDGNESMMNGMLYDKINDSMNNFTNHVFSTSHDSNVDELHLSGKLDVPESDAVQQILDETWTAETSDGDDFKINEANTSSSISVSFDNALEFVDEKNTSEKSDVDVDSDTKPIDQSSSSSSFSDSDSLLMESSLQNIIVDGDSISYDNSLKATSQESTDVENEAECKDNVIFAFNQSQTENTSQEAAPSSASEPSAVEETTEPKRDTPQEDPELDQSVTTSEPESFTETVDKDLSTDSPDHYKSQDASYEYENIPPQSAKINSTLAYNFESASKSEFASEEITPSDSDSAPSLDQPEEPLVEPSEQSTEAEESNEPEPCEQHDTVDESLCSGDSEAQNTSIVSSTDAKESEPPTHGESKPIEQVESCSTSDKFEDSLPSEENPQ